LLKLMVGLLKPDRGRIFLNGQEITGLDAAGLARVRKTTGFLFQNAASLDSVSAAENLALPLRFHSPGKAEEQIQDLVRQKLGQVGLTEHSARMPADLSVGMRKRLALARALVLDPDILLIDDPAGGIDPVAAAEMERLLLELKRERHATLVIVSYDPARAERLSDQLAVLEGGRLVAIGSAEQLKRSDNPVVQQLISPPIAEDVA
jgi:phospholipid/cholesterol/gamma-HCH transport system ATP-binding protein